MDINQLSKKIENKLLKDTFIKDVKIIDNTYKHLKHNSHQKGKFHIKLEIKSDLILLVYISSISDLFFTKRNL